MLLRLKGSSADSHDDLYSYPTRALLEENGIDASGSLARFSDIGEPSAVAALMSSRREKETTNTQILSARATDTELYFTLQTEIEVQKPELLMEQYGVDRLFRITTAKASLAASDGNLMAVFASALEKDFQTDGPMLQQVVESFAVTEREYGF